MKRMGLRICPCGTPLVQGLSVDETEFIDTNCSLSVRKDISNYIGGHECRMQVN